ncbi:ABC transporter ATP-binding protein [Paenibacillus chitinolyticus]|uniref:ABC transporter ATP-binding protein n=1 Tax=Paenibacillus chitinolyticus TaxID=79263 RepID=UPI00366DCC64
MITATNLNKTFRTPVVRQGRMAGLRSLLSREYRSKTAVNDVNFTIGRGDFVGFIGPNGAGKSTTIKMLTGILHPTSGEVRISGLSPQRDRRRVVAKLGVVFGQRSQLWWDLPVRDSYEILAAMYRVREEDLKRKLAELGELLGLCEFMDTPVRKLSLGQRMRADLAAAMLHDPDILFLDEPTIGLDVAAKQSIRGFLHKLNKEAGKTILLTTHDMDDIEQLCERVIVINGGTIGYDGTVEGMRQRIGLPTIMTVRYRGACGFAGGEADKGYPFRVTAAEKEKLVLEFNRTDIGPMEVLQLAGGWGEIADVHMQEPDFEDIVHRVY